MTSSVQPTWTHLYLTYTSLTVWDLYGLLFQDLGYLSGVLSLSRGALFQRLGTPPPMLAFSCIS